MPRRVDDEWYTRAEDVDRMFAPYGTGFFDGMRVLCPCDTARSEYVRYLERHGARVTWSDPPDFESWNFADFDAIVTNPPFSQASEVVTKICDAGVPCHILLPPASLFKKPAIRATRDGYRFYGGLSPHIFARPDGSARTAPTYIMTSWPYPESALTRRPCRPAPPLMTDEGIPRYRRSRDVPQDVTGAVAVPCSFFACRADADAWWPLSRADLHYEGKALYGSLLVTRCAVTP